MRVQIIDDKQLKNCSICDATDEWVENICVNGIEGLYCVKCDTLTLHEPLPSKLVYRKMSFSVQPNASKPTTADKYIFTAVESANYGTATG